MAATSRNLAGNVALARARSMDRIGMPPAHIPPALLDTLAPISAEARSHLRDELERDQLTGRGYHRVRRVARTIADLEGDNEVVELHHVVLAIQLRVRLGVTTRERAA